uniref:F-box domain-containing protein n=1 Tax=Heterorhabditis bacteriophora TaxID=37862 RepID=A0A1I7WSA6_HETBA
MIPSEIRRLKFVSKDIKYLVENGGNRQAMDRLSIHELERLDVSDDCDFSDDDLFAGKYKNIELIRFSVFERALRRILDETLECNCCIESCYFGLRNAIDVDRLTSGLPHLVKMAEFDVALYEKWPNISRKSPDVIQNRLHNFICSRFTQTLSGTSRLQVRLILNQVMYFSCLHVRPIKHIYIYIKGMISSKNNNIIHSRKTYEEVQYFFFHLRINILSHLKKFHILFIEFHLWTYRLGKYILCQETLPWLGLSRCLSFTPGGHLFCSLCHQVLRHIFFVLTHEIGLFFFIKSNFLFLVHLNEHSSIVRPVIIQYLFGSAGIILQSSSRIRTLPSQLKTVISALNSRTLSQARRYLREKDIHIKDHSLYYARTKVLSAIGQSRGPLAGINVDQLQKLAFNSYGLTKSISYSKDYRIHGVLQMKVYQNRLFLFRLKEQETFYEDSKLFEETVVTALVLTDLFVSSHVILTIRTDDLP